MGWSSSRNLTNQKLIQLTGHKQEIPIETVDLDYLFRNCAQEKDWHDETQKKCPKVSVADRNTKG